MSATANWMIASPYDGSLVERAIGGDRAAWRELHREYYPVAAAFMRKLGITENADVEDACQEVFVRMFRYLPTFRGEAVLKTWLYRLCVTEADRARRRSRLGTKLKQLLAREAPERLAPGHESSEQAARRQLDQALSAMNDGMRLVFVLFEIEGLSGEQTAEIAGIPIASVWTRLHYARRIVKKTLAIAEENGDP